MYPKHCQHVYKLGSHRRVTLSPLKLFKQMLHLNTKNIVNRRYVNASASSCEGNLKHPRIRCFFRIPRMVSMEDTSMFLIGRSLTCSCIARSLVYDENVASYRLTWCNANSMTLCLAPPERERNEIHETRSGE